MLSMMIGRLAPPEQADYLYGFAKHLLADVRRRPGIAQNMFVEVFAGSESQEEAVGHHGGNGRGCLGDNRGMQPLDRTGYTGTDPKAGRRACDTSQHRPDKG